MKNLKFSRLFAAALLVACFAFAGCKPQVEEVTKLVAVRPIEADDGIIGTWNGTYPGEKYTITTSAFDSDGSYSGNNLYIAETSDTTGYIFIKYTKSYMYSATEPNPSTGWIHVAPSEYSPTEYWYCYSADGNDVGKWYAINYKDLTASSVKLSAAYGTKSSCATLKEAVKEFTVDNGYYNMYSTCTKE